MYLSLSLSLSDILLTVLTNNGTANSSETFSVCISHLFVCGFFEKTKQLFDLAEIKLQLEQTYKQGVVRV